MAEKLNLPNKVIDADWKDDIDLDYELYGGNEKQEREYISEAPENAELIDRKEVKNASVKRAKNRRVGIVALFKEDDLLAA